MWAFYALCKFGSTLNLCYLFTVLERFSADPEAFSWPRFICLWSTESWSESRCQAGEDVGEWSGVRLRADRRRGLR